MACPCRGFVFLAWTRCAQEEPPQTEGGGGDAKVGKPRVAPRLWRPAACAAGPHQRIASGVQTDKHRPEAVFICRVSSGVFVRRKNSPFRCPTLRYSRKKDPPPRKARGGSVNNVRSKPMTNVVALSAPPSFLPPRPRVWLSSLSRQGKTTGSYNPTHSCEWSNYRFRLTPRGARSFRGYGFRVRAEQRSSGGFFVRIFPTPGLHHLYSPSSHRF